MSAKRRRSKAQIEQEKEDAIREKEEIDAKLAKYDKM